MIKHKEERSLFYSHLESQVKSFHSYLCRLTFNHLQPACGSSSSYPSSSPWGLCLLVLTLSPLSSFLSNLPAALLCYLPFFCVICQSTESSSVHTKFGTQLGNFHYPFYPPFWSLQHHYSFCLQEPILPP